MLYQGGAAAIVGEGAAAAAPNPRIEANVAVARTAAIRDRIEGRRAAVFVVCIGGR